MKSKKKTPADDGKSNNVRRPVYNGHWVKVLPDPLANPRLVIHSPSMAEDLGLSQETVKSDEFARFFSGDVLGAFDGSDDEDEHKERVMSWATPYALSMMGRRYTSNCPFGTG